MKEKKILFFYSHVNFSTISASSPQEAFSLAVTTFIESTDDEERLQAEQWLMEWQRDPNSLQLAMEVIDTSNNLNDVFFSTLAVDFILNNLAEQLNSEILNNMFFVLQRRFLHSLPPGLDEKCRNLIAQNLACLSSLNPDFIDDKNWEECTNQDDIILYYVFLAERYDTIKKQDESSKIFSQKLTDENKIAFLILLLSQVQSPEQITPAWINLLKFIGQQVDEDKFYSNAISGFLPILQAIPDQQHLYPVFFDFFTEIFADYIGGFAIEISLAQELIIILVNMVEKLFDEGDDEEQAVQFASLAWNEIMDYEEEFFLDCTDDFIAILLEKFLISMRLLIVDPSMFSSLLDPATYKFPCLVRNNANLFPFIFQFIDIIILAINTDYDEYINDENVRDILEVAIFKLTNFVNDKQCEDELDDIKINISQYFEEIIKDLNDGTIFAFASASKYVKENLASVVAEQILSSNPIPQSSLQFIRIIDVSAFNENRIDIGSQNVNGFISLAYASFVEDPNIPAIQAISKLTLQLPQIFIGNPDDLIIPLTSWIQESDPQFTQYIMSCLLYLTACIFETHPQNSFIEKALLLITTVISDQTSTLLQNDLPTMFNFVSEIVCRTHKIIQDLSDSYDEKIVQDLSDSYDEKIVQDLSESNDQKIEILERNQVIMKKKQETIQFLYEYFRQIFNQIVNIFEPLWHFQSDQIMCSLCKFLLDSYENGLIDDYSKIIVWIGEALYIMPVVDHFDLLGKPEIYNLLPTEPIMEFIVSFPEIEDSELQLKIYSFIYNLFIYEWEDFFEFFDIDLILSPLTSNDSRMVDSTIDLVCVIVRSDCCGEEQIVQILNIIVDGMLTNFQQNSIERSITVFVNTIVYEKLQADQIVQIVFSHLKYDSQEARDFQAVLESITSENDEPRLLKPLKKMAFLYHKQDENEDDNQ